MVRAAVKELDSNLPIYRVRTLSENLGHPVRRERTVAALLSLFGALALFLSMLGLYGLISYLVSQRTHEIGIRLALGAQPGDVLLLILRQGMTVSGLGIIFGVVASIWLTTFLSSYLFEVAPNDPRVFIAAAGSLAAVAFLACLVPARRATQVDPMVALRYE